MDTVAMPLGLPPRIRLLAVRSRHGEHGDEHYRLGRFWCLNMYEGEGELRIANRVHPFHSGCASITWPDTDHRYRFARPTRKTLVHVVPAPTAEPATMPVMQDLGPRFAATMALLIEAHAVQATQPSRSTAIIWALLWGLATAAPSKPPPLLHPALRHLLERLDDDLATPLSAEGLCRRFELSPAHLNRLCHAAFGAPFAAYVRRRRLDHALHLLRHTGLPIAAIGAQVGFADPQHFNKLVRKAAGSAPRRVREQG